MLKLSQLNKNIVLGFGFLMIFFAINYSLWLMTGNRHQPDALHPYYLKINGTFYYISGLSRVTLAVLLTLPVLSFLFYIVKSGMDYFKMGHPHE